MIAEVLDTLEGLFHVSKRSPTLDGSVPLRVARACAPLLEGNAYGLQVVLTRPLSVRRRFGRWSATWPDGAGDVEKRHGGAWPRLPVEGYLDPRSAWLDALRGGVVRGSGSGLTLFTGLLLRPAKGVWLRVTSAANRRNTLFEVREQLIADDGRWIPLQLELRVRPGAPAAFRLEGELACLGPLRPDVRFESLPVRDAPELLATHAGFYDREYFEDKREETTLKYRRLQQGQPHEASTPGTAACTVAVVGSSRHAVERLDGFTTASGPSPERRNANGGLRIDSVRFRNELAFSALYDGHSLALDYDRSRLALATRPVSAAFREALEGTPALKHPGSELYLTKYFTPHPPGEPHFFVKPWALVRTPPGWSSLVEGVHGDGYDVLRGVISTDLFHATPAVFRVHREGARISVAEDAPLLRVIPVPRALLDGAVEVARLA